MSAASLRLAAGSAELVVDVEHGGRIASFRVDGHELLVDEPDEPMWWGSYPMVPFAGRVRYGRLTFRGQDHQLPRNHAPHAIHGTAFERPWEHVGPGAIGVDLGDGWPFHGRVTQRFVLAPGSLEVELVLHAEQAMPAMLGWHPWFRRRLGAPLPTRELRAQAAPDVPQPGDARLDLAAGAMYVRGADGLPTGELVPPPPGPWDDCFTGLRRMPVLEWPGVVRLTIGSTLDHWVVFDELARGICVEPQSGPPNQVNTAPRVVEAGDRFAATMTWRWETLASPAAGDGQAGG